MKNVTVKNAEVLGKLLINCGCEKITAKKVYSQNIHSVEQIAVLEFTFKNRIAKGSSKSKSAATYSNLKEFGISYFTGIKSLGQSGGFRAVYSDELRELIALSKDLKDKKAEPKKSAPKKTTPKKAEPKPAVVSDEEVAKKYLKSLGVNDLAKLVFEYFK